MGRTDLAPWTLSDALLFVRWLKPLLEAAPIPMYPALTGSVLFEGASGNDLDIVLYPRTKTRTTLGRHEDGGDSIEMLAFIKYLRPHGLSLVTSHQRVREWWAIEKHGFSVKEWNALTKAGRDVFLEGLDAKCVQVWHFCTVDARAGRLAALDSRRRRVDFFFLD